MSTPRPRLAQVDAHLRTWRGVAFAILAVDLGLDECLLRARAAMLGLVETAKGTA